MKRIAILGCENSHANAFLKFIREREEFSDVEVVGVYSDQGEAAEKLNELRGCEVHMTHMATPGDEAGLRRLGCRYTSDPYYATTAIFTARQ